MADSSRRHHIPVLQALFVTFLWSTSWVLIKIGLKDIPAISFAGMRYTLAFLLLAPAVLASATRREELRHAQTVRLAAALPPGCGVLLRCPGRPVPGPRLSARSDAQFDSQLFPCGGGVARRRVPGGTPHPPPVGRARFLSARGGDLLPPARGVVRFTGLAVAAVCLLANSFASLLGRAVNRRGDVHPLLVTVVSMGVGSLLLLAVGFIVEGVPRLDLSGGVSLVGWPSSIPPSRSRSGTTRCEASLLSSRP